MRSLATASVLPLFLPALLRAQATPIGPPGYVYGTVSDSLSGRVLAGASVMLVDAADPAARTLHADADARGRFRIDSVPPGAYMAGFADPLLDTLRIEAPMRRIAVPAGQGARIDLATPSTPTLRRAYCGARADSASFGVMVGAVRDAVSRNPLAAGRVVGRTPMVAVRDGRIQTDMLEVTATAGADGAFFLCGLPPGHPIDVIASDGPDSSGTVTLDLPPTGLLARDLFVGAASGGTMTGRVVRSGGAPIPGAHLLLERTGRTAVSDDSGHFALRGVPLGTRTLYARAIGFFPEQRAVDVLGGDAAPLELTLPTMQSVLDTIHVYGQRVFRDREAFEQREQMGFGTILQRARIEAMRPVHASDILHAVVGLRVARVGAALALDIRGRFCLPDVLVDGHPIPLQKSLDEIDAWIQPQEIQAMEVYIGASAPAEYLQPGRPGCATILIWTNPAFSMPIPK